MKRVAMVIGSLLFCMTLIACESNTTPAGNATPNQNSQDESRREMMIDIQVGEKIFKARLIDNATSQAFIAQLPLTLDMSELNGNEKYHYLQNALPTSSDSIGHITTGDLMLYGNNCIVLFYESFSTSYNYTRLGHIEAPAGLKNALGRGNVQMKFTLSP